MNKVSSISTSRNLNQLTDFGLGLRPLPDAFLDPNKVSAICFICSITRILHVLYILVFCRFYTLNILPCAGSATERSKIFDI